WRGFTSTSSIWSMRAVWLTSRSWCLPARTFTGWSGGFPSSLPSREAGTSPLMSNSRVPNSSTAPASAFFPGPLALFFAAPGPPRRPPPPPPAPGVTSQEKRAERVRAVDTRDGLAEQPVHGEHPDLPALLRGLRQRHGVGEDDLLQLRVLDPGDGGAGEDGVH